MIVTAIDCFYILMIAIIFGFIVHLEVQIKTLHTMMAEHVKCDASLTPKNSKKPLDK
jgi:hypothetical protein